MKIHVTFPCKSKEGDLYALSRTLHVPFKIDDQLNRLIKEIEAKNGVAANVGCSVAIEKNGQVNFKSAYLTALKDIVSEAMK